MLHFISLYYQGLSLLLLFHLQINAQDNNFSIKKYHVQDGLPDNYILSIYQDSQKFLWIGTNNGLSRFDGKNFINYGSQQGLTNLYINQVFEDSKKRLWIGTRNNIFQFWNNRFVETSFSDIDHVKYIHDILELKNGEIWALTDNGTYKLEKEQWLKKSFIAGFDNKVCRQIIETAKGIYVNYGDCILFKQKNYISSIVKSTPAFSNQFIYNSIAIHNNTLYVTTREGIYYLTKEKHLKRVFKNLTQDGGWKNIFIDSKNRFWLSQSSRPVYISNAHDNENSTDSIRLNNTLISNLFEDKDQNIWIASNDGLLKVQNTGSIHFNQGKNHLIEDIRFIVETPENKILAFSGKNGILIYNGKDFHQAPFQFTSANNADVYDFPDSYSLDEKNNLWFATRKRRLFSLNKDKLINHSSVLNGDHTLGWISYNADLKKMLFSCDTLKIETKNGLQTFKMSKEKKIIVFPTFIHCFKNGKSIISSAIKGVALIDKYQNYHSINKELGLDKEINSSRFYEESDGSFWMYGNGDGIKHFIWNKNGLPQKNLHVTSDHGIIAQRIFDMVIDKKNQVWISSLSGVAFIRINRQTKQIQVYPLENNKEIMLNHTGFSKLLVSHDGRVWLAGSNSIYAFDPNKIDINNNKPATTIQEMQINLKPTNWQNYSDSFNNYGQIPINPILNYKENNLQISFAGLSFTSTPDFLYSYSLSGLDDTWSNPDSRNYVIYTNLTPGKYIFNVKGKTKSGNWSEPVTFSFKIQPPFWGTWWFRLLMIIAAAFIINRIYQKQVLKIKNKAAIQQQLLELEMTALKSQMNPHFIYNALGSIQSLVVSEKKDEAVFYIGTFSRLLRQVLEQSEDNVITLFKELETLKHYIALESLRLNMEVSYNIHIDSQIDDFYEKIPPLILQPFVENSLWHGLSNKQGAKKFSINIYAQNEWLACIIEDNGIGREKAAAAKSLNAQQHKSKAIDITIKRLIDFNEDKNTNPVVYKDLVDDNGIATGTQVIIKFKRTV